MGSYVLFGFPIFRHLAPDEGYPRNTSLVLNCISIFYYENSQGFDI
jgi:hypothetical protein